MVKRRRRFKQSVAFKDRLASFARELRGEASRLPPSREKEELLERANQADTAARLDAWASSSKPHAAMLAEGIWGMRSGPETPIPASRGAARAEALRSPCVMIVEDEYYLAADLELALRSEGAETVGPIGRVSDALRRVANRNFDAAVVDINLQNEHAYALADELKARGIPFVFATGYTQEVVPSRFSHVTLFEKPYHVHGVARHVVQLCGTPA